MAQGGRRRRGYEREWLAGVVRGGGDRKRRGRETDSDGRRRVGDRLTLALPQRRRRLLLLLLLGRQCRPEVSRPGRPSHRASGPRRQQRHRHRLSLRPRPDADEVCKCARALERLVRGELGGCCVSLFDGSRWRERGREGHSTVLLAHRHWVRSRTAEAVGSRRRGRLWLMRRWDKRRCGRGERRRLGRADRDGRAVPVCRVECYWAGGVEDDR